MTSMPYSYRISLYMTSMPYSYRILNSYPTWNHRTSRFIQSRQVISDEAEGRVGYHLGETEEIVMSDDSISDNCVILYPLLFLYLVNIRTKLSLNSHYRHQLFLSTLSSLFDVVDVSTESVAIYCLPKVSKQTTSLVKTSICLSSYLPSPSYHP